MAITRANVETILVKRLGPALTKAGMATTVAGSNADLNDPIGWAARQCGLTVASLTAVADSDLSGLASSGYDKLLDLAEYRTLETVIQNLDDVDVKLGPRDEKFSQLANQLQKRLEAMLDKLKADYGYGAATIWTGVLIHEFAEHADGSVSD